MVIDARVLFGVGGLLVGGAMLKFERCAVCGKLTWKPVNRSALAMDAAGNLVLMYLCPKHYLQYLIARNEPEPTDDVEPDA